MADPFGTWQSVRRVRTRWWTSVPCSVALHGLALVCAIIVPLAATGALPTPTSVLAFTITPPPPPPAEPIVTRVAPAPAAPVAAVTPTEAPPVLAPEPAVPAPTAAPFVVEGLTVPRETVVPFFGAATPFVPVAPRTPVPVGGVVRPPVKIVDVAPVYPALARQAHVAGTVAIEAVIGVDGRVTAAHVVRSSPLLDEAALVAVRQWRYNPTVLNGEPIAVILTVTVAFVLR